MVNLLNFKKKAQAISVDLMIVIIIILFGVLFIFLNSGNELEKQILTEENEKASTESKILMDDLRTKGIVSNENEVNVEEFLTLNYEGVKQDLGINDFAIVLEKDGKLVKIDPENDINCIGTSKIIVNGQPCSN